MMNCNGTLHPDAENLISTDNRGYKYGDALFETLKVVHGKILFWEDHYFRLMSSMRILRMEIPMNFTMEYLETEILKTVEANALLKATARVRLNVHRKDGGKYRPDTNHIDFNIQVEQLKADFYSLNSNIYTVELFKDFFVAPGLLSTLKSNNKLIYILGSIYADENKFENCLILNTNKNVVEALNGNIFLVKGSTIKTPPIDDGCLKGIMRKQVIDIIRNSDEYEFIEASISPFELQQAEELFVTNVVVGIQPISLYRKKEYTHDTARKILEKLNLKIRLS